MPEFSIIVSFRADDSKTVLGSEFLIGHEEVLNEPEGYMAERFVKELRRFLRDAKEHFETQTSRGARANG